MKLENVKDIYPLSPMQEGMLFHSVADPHSAAYIDHVVITIQGELNTERLSQSLKSVAARHDCLRTAFVWDGVDQPLQIVREKVDFKVEVIDWTSMHDAGVENLVEKRIEWNQNIGFELDDAPLLHFTVCKGARDVRLIICFHHLILDGWSAHAFLKEVLQEYDEPSAVPAAPFRFRDYIAWHGSRDHESSLEFWKAELAGFEQPNRIGRAGRVLDDQKFGQIRKKLPADVSSRLSDIAKSSRVTLNTVFQAIWSLTVSRYSSGETDIVFGTTVAGRPLELAGIENAIGSFINTIPFRTQINSSEPLTYWFERIQTTQAARLQHDFSSLASIQKASEIEFGQALFESILVFENYPASDRSAGSIKVTGIEHFEQSNYPVALIVVPGDEVELFLVFDETYFADDFVEVCNDFVEGIAEYVCHLCARLASDSSGPVSSLISLSPEMTGELDQWNRSGTPLDEKLAGRCVHAVFSELAAENPEAIAAIFAGKQVTYRELEERAHQVAVQLIERGVSRGDVVGLCVDRS
ncbi:MAG: condensation domain-containing protein, partial [Planctomycetota bacterium]